MAIGDKTLQFLPEDIEVFDMHTHIDTINGCNIRSTDAESVIKYMDKLNFKKVLYHPLVLSVMILSLATIT